MHEGLNRDDGRHWCAPDETDGSVNPLECACGRVWELTGNVWSQVGPDVSAPVSGDEVDLAPVPGEDPGPAQDVDERDDEVDV